MSGFRSIKLLGIFLFPLDGMVVHCRATPSIKFTSIHLYTWVKAGTFSKVSHPKHDAKSGPEFTPGPLDLECNVLTTRSPCLPQARLSNVT